MAYEQREGSGSLFPNRKTKDSQPDWQGEAKINGQMFRISGWIKEGRNGNWLSLSIQPKTQGGRPPIEQSRPDSPTPQIADSHDKGFDDDIPF